MRIAIFFALLLLPLGSGAAPCDESLAKATELGAINPDELAFRQRCEDTVYRTRKISETYYVCVFSGKPSSAAIEKYGNRPLTVIAADDAKSQDHFSEITGIWFSHAEGSGGKKSKGEQVSVTVGTIGTTITRRSSLAQSRRSTLDRISLILNDHSLRFESSVKSGSSEVRSRSKVYSCDKNLSQAEIDEEERKKLAKSLDAKARFRGNTRTFELPSTEPRSSEVTGGQGQKK